MQGDHLSGKPGNVREMSGISLKVMEMSGKKSFKIVPTGFLVASLSTLC